VNQENCKGLIVILIADVIYRTFEEHGLICTISPRQKPGSHGGTTHPGLDTKDALVPALRKVKMKMEGHHVGMVPALLVCQDVQTS
jgi:hypothetical protein